MRELFVIKDERWSTVARLESIEDAYRFVAQQQRAASAGWSLWRETDAEQRQILAPGVLAAQAEAWDVSEGDRADREAGASEMRRDRDQRGD